MAEAPTTDNAVTPAEPQPSGGLLSYFTWIPTSMKALEEAERKLLQCLKTAWRGRFVPIRSGQCQLWTVIVNEKALANRTPVVLVHGFGGGVGLWAHNYDTISRDRAVFAFDLLGFGRSSRPEFSRDATLAELEWVQSVEDWRRKVGLDKFVLVGHSLGGFLSASYALEYPQHVRHLVLVDPWGFPAKPPASEQQISLPPWVRLLASFLSFFNPLSSLRVAGPWGSQMVRRFRPDLGRKFPGDSIYDYIYHCNVQSPSGEVAFKNMSIPFGWAKRPMIERLPELRKDVPVTFIYGSRSWIDSGPGYLMQHQLRPESYVGVDLVKGAGHHVYADQAEDFNQRILGVCDLVDRNEDQPTEMVSEGV